MLDESKVNVQEVLKSGFSSRLKRLFIKGKLVEFQIYMGLMIIGRESIFGVN